MKNRSSGSREFHFIPTFRVGTRYGVTGLLWFWNFEHRSALVALDPEGFRPLYFRCIAKGSADVCRPSYVVFVGISRGVHLLLFQRKTHLSLPLFRLGFLAACWCLCRHVNRSSLSVVIFNDFGCIPRQGIQKCHLLGCEQCGRSFRAQLREEGAL